MKEIELGQIYDLLECPLLYKLKHVSKFPTKEEYSTKKILSEGIHYSIYYFFSEVRDGKIPSLKQMKEKWASYYYGIFKEDMKTKENFMLGRTAMDKKRLEILTKGYEVIYNFYSKYSKNPGVIIAVNQPFFLTLDKKTKIKGCFEVIREVEDKDNQTRHIELLDFRTSKKSDEIQDFSIKHDISSTIMFFAFKQLFQTEPDRMILDYSRTGISIEVKKEQNEINRVKHILKGMKHMLETDSFYPRQSGQCRYCPMMSYCNRLEFEEV